MNDRYSKVLALLILTSVVGSFTYALFYRKYIYLPRQDLTFLTSNPARDAVLQNFGKPHEELRAGQRFQMTGWYPLPDREASHSALSYIRSNGDKLYIFFDSQDQIEFFQISHS